MSKKIEFPKLPVTFKKRWVKALRSGKYKSTIGKLCKIENKKISGFCCLGVAGHIQGIPATQLEHRSFLSRGAITGFKDKVPKILIGNGNIGLPRKLATMNDGKMGFKRIATWIDKHL